jgi:hypothetical protein
MKLLKQLTKNIIIHLLGKNDPVHNCRLYREQGCSYVDSCLCDFPNCSMNNEYVKEKEDESKSN